MSIHDFRTTMETISQQELVDRGDPRYGNIKELKKAGSPKGQIEVRYTNAKSKPKEESRRKASLKKEKSEEAEASRAP